VINPHLDVGGGALDGREGAPRKVDVRLPGKGNSNSPGARPVHQIILMIKWIRTSRLSIKNYLSVGRTSTWAEAGVHSMGGRAQCYGIVNLIRPPN